MVLRQIAAEIGLTVSQPTDQQYDGISLMTKEGRDRVDAVMERDDPWLATYSFPCGPWNPWTAFN
eukprot:2487784-Lingulodinium_polyedra.AAC.1